MGNKIVAVVGMCGAGKSEVTNEILKKGFKRIYFGDVTFDEIKRRGLERNWQTEKLVREEFRASGDMAIYAKLNAPKIAETVKIQNVCIESLYSWSEYKYLKDIYGDDFFLISVVTNLGVREKRLSTRKVRPMTVEDVKDRDYSEIENLEKGGPIGRADFYILNNGSMVCMKYKTNSIIRKILKCKK